MKVLNREMRDLAKINIIDADQSRYDVNELLMKSKGWVNTAAKIANVDRRTIHRLLKKHNISGKNFN